MRPTTADSDPVDQVDEMLKKTGCIEYHHKVQECIAEKKDWRKCQKEVQEFRLCMNQRRESNSENKPVT